MPVRHTLLAILDNGRCYGNQLRQEFDRRTGAGSPLNVGQVYTTLDRLERDGLVAQSGADDHGHVLYEITDDGRAECARWLHEPVARNAATRDELALKLAVAVTLPGLDAAAIICGQRAASELSLADLLAAGPGGTDVAALIIHDALVCAAEAELRLLDLCAARVARGEVAPFPINAETPRRGRPAKARH